MGANMGVIGPAPPVPPAIDPVVTSISTVNWKDGTAGITFTGTDFGDAGASVDASYQGTDQNDTVSGSMTVTDQTDTQLTITVVIPTDGGVDQSGFYDVLVTHSTGAVSNTTQVLIGPNQTVSGGGVEHESGLVDIDFAADIIQDKIDAELAGTFYHCFNLAEEKSFIPQANDQYIGDSTCGMRGSKKFTDGAGGTWAADGSSWKETNQTQNETSGGITATMRTGWDAVNRRTSDLWIGDNVQDIAKLARVRRYPSKAAAEAALVAAATLSGSTPIETHLQASGVNRKFRSDLFWVTQTAHGMEAGDCFKLTGCDAVGGITPNGLYNVVQVEANRFLARFGSDATSATTGGGSSVMLTKFVGEFFDEGTNTRWLNIDPTSNIEIYAATTTRAITHAVGGVIIKGQDNDNKWPFYQFMNDMHDGAAVHFANGASRENWLLKFLDIHHNHGAGVRFEDDGHRVEDCVSTANGALGFTVFGQSSGPVLITSFLMRRCIMDYNGWTGVNRAFVAGIKLQFCGGIDVDQISCGRNNGGGFWPDSQNFIAAAKKIKRVHSYANASHNFYWEANKVDLQGDGDSIIENCLLQESGWEFNAFNAIQPACMQMDRNSGDTTHRSIFRNSVVEVANYADTGPNNGIRIGTTTGSPDSDYNESTGNRIVYQGVTKGIPGSGFMGFGSISQSEIDNMKLNAVINNNTYYHTGSSTDKIFSNIATGNSNPRKTLAEWLDLDLNKWDPDSTVNFDATAPLVDLPWGDIPVWDDILLETTTPTL